MQQVIPLPEAAAYQVQLREKEKKVRKDRKDKTEATRQWDEGSFFAELEKQHGVVAVETARTILDWARPTAKEISFGSGQQSGSVYPLFDNEYGKQVLIGLWTSGRISFAFGAMKKFPPFNDDSKRRELFRRLNEISALPPDGMDKFPSIPLDALTNKAAMDQFLVAMDWAVNEIRGK